ncbi:CPBP family intramembrane glutamic endopeptidase [Domibacillus indicus]|uniref:CPBP family intramembrane glutamic endopeptidase n=1 Tax=Domibacillus indicus TaxID=1437523 RepID=UPI000617FF3C|nr:CPBP family intramembrane glutamic endopeptidase [Domibacillus indicus]
MEIWYWLVLVFLLTYEPVYGFFDYQKFKHRVQRNPGERVTYYKKVMAGLWLPALFILGLAAIGPPSLEDIGLKGVSLDTQTLGKWPVYISLSLAALYIVSLIYYLIGSKISGKMKNEIVKVKQSELEKSKFADILPVTKKDKTVWTYVSWTAGITEEIIYRGFLIFALPLLFPSLSTWAVLLVSAVLFGLAHTYQGAANVVKTAIFGLFFAVLYIGLDSVIPLILLHFFIDYIGKIGDEGNENQV